MKSIDDTKNTINNMQEKVTNEMVGLRLDIDAHNKELSEILSENNEKFDSRLDKLSKDKDLIQEGQVKNKDEMAKKNTLKEFTERAKVLMVDMKNENMAIAQENIEILNNMKKEWNHMAEMLKKDKPKLEESIDDKMNDTNRPWRKSSMS
jgi:hypothetical protein